MSEYEPLFEPDEARDIIDFAVRDWVARRRAKKRMERLRLRQRALKRRAAKKKHYAAIDAKPKPKPKPVEEQKDEYPCSFTTTVHKPSALVIDCKLSSEIKLQANAWTFELENLDTIRDQVEELWEKVLAKLASDYQTHINGKDIVSFFLDDTASPNDGETQIKVITIERWQDWSAEMIMVQIRKKAQSGKLILLNQHTVITFQVARLLT